MVGPPFDKIGGIFIFSLHQRDSYIDQIEPIRRRGINGPPWGPAPYRVEKVDSHFSGKETL
jgi:hypothetical protein